jgi:hypothetical protein
MAAAALDTRTDWLEIAYRVQLARPVRVALAKAAGTARLHGKARLRLGPWDFHVKRTSRGYLLTDRILRVTVDLDAPGELASRAAARRREIEDLQVAALDEATAEDAEGLQRSADYAEERRAAQEALRREPPAVVMATAHGCVMAEDATEHLPGWTVVIAFAQEFLAQWGTPMGPSTIGLVCARQFGAVWESRVRRVDLAVTLAGFDLRESDRGMLSGTRAKRDDFADLGAPPDEWSFTQVSRHFEGGEARYTGMSVAPGNPIHCRMYDKRRELEVKGTDDKRAIEASLWDAAPMGHLVRYDVDWRKGEQGPRVPVTRVEFQVRGEALDRWPDARNPNALRGELDRIWDYCTNKWLRIVDPTLRDRRGAPITRKSRARADARWQVVQRCEFWGPASRAFRPCQRRSEGVRTRVMLGYFLSRVAAEEACNDDVGEVGHDRAMGILRRAVAWLEGKRAQLSLWADEGERDYESAARGEVARVVGQLGLLAADSVSGALLREAPTADAVLALVSSRVEAASARFAAPPVMGAS